MSFVILRAGVCWLYYKKRREITEFRLVWLYILLSFLFYIPVTVLAGVIPALGMLMLPKTVCYILMLSAFSSLCIRQKRPAGMII